MEAKLDAVIRGIQGSIRKEVDLELTFAEKKPKKSWFYGGGEVCPAARAGERIRLTLTTGGGFLGNMEHPGVVETAVHRR